MNDERPTLDGLLDVLKEADYDVLEGWFDKKSYRFRSVHQNIPAYKKRGLFVSTGVFPTFEDQASVTARNDKGRVDVGFKLWSSRKVTEIHVSGQRNYGKQYHTGSVLVPVDSALYVAAKMIAFDHKVEYGANRQSLYDLEDVPIPEVPNVIERILDAEDRLLKILKGLKRQEQRVLNEEAKKLLQYAPLEDT